MDKIPSDMVRFVHSEKSPGFQNYVGMLDS